MAEARQTKSGIDLGFRGLSDNKNRHPEIAATHAAAVNKPTIQAVSVLIKIANAYQQSVSQQAHYGSMTLQNRPCQGTSSQQ
jgi:hypothetical protein